MSMLGEAGGRRSKLVVEVTLGQGSEVKLRGQIDETADLVKLTKGLRNPVRFDLEGVDFINSLGVRAWVHMLRTLKSLGLQASARRCSEAMVTQMNMVWETRLPVESFYTSYLCEACGLLAKICLEVAEHEGKLYAGEAPELACTRCGTQMLLDEFPERYLLFLTEPRRLAAQQAAKKS